MASIYNTTDGPLAIDRAGRVIGAGERRDVDTVDQSPLSGHIAAGRILVREDAAKPTAGKPGRQSTRTQEA